MKLTIAENLPSHARKSAPERAVVRAIVLQIIDTVILTAGIVACGKHHLSHT